MSTLTKKEMQRLQAAQPFMPEFTDAEVLSVVFRTDPAFVANVVPRPVRPADEPLAQAFVAHYPRTNFGVTYNEAAMFVPVTHRHALGAYCPTMPVDDRGVAVRGPQTHLGGDHKGQGDHEHGDDQAVSRPRRITDISRSENLFATFWIDDRPTDKTMLRPVNSNAKAATRVSRSRSTVTRTVPSTGS